MNKPKTLTEMFRDHVGLPPLTDKQDIKEYINEREGMRIDSGESEQEAVEGARQDLERLQGIKHDDKSLELDL